MFKITLLSPLHGIKHELIPPRTAVFIGQDVVVDSITRERLLVCLDGKWFVLRELEGQWSDQARGWDFVQIEAV
jgi:hypothetical protein